MCYSTNAYFIQPTEKVKVRVGNVYSMENLVNKHMATDISLETALSKFGLCMNEMRIYGFLLRNGESKVSKIARNLKVSPTNVYPLVKTLMNRGFVESTFTNPVRLHAVPLSEALGMFITQRRIILSREINSLEKSKANIIAKSVAKYNTRVEAEKAETETFQILKGGSIYSKLLTSLDKTSKNLCLFMSKQNFVELYNSEFLDNLTKRIEDKGVWAVFLLDESLRNMDVERAGAKVRFMHTKEANTNDFFVFDEKEVFYYLDKPTASKGTTVLWTTLPSLVMIFKNVFKFIVKIKLKEESHAFALNPE